MKDEKQTIDELLDFNEETNVEISKDIRKGIIKSVYIRVLISLVVIALLVVGGYFGASKIYKAVHYNPFNETINGTIIGDYTKNETPEFDVLMSAYYDLSSPGYSYDKSNSIKYSGFGNYEVIGSTYNRFDGKQQQTNFQIKDSKQTNVISEVEGLEHFLYDDNPEGAPEDHQWENYGKEEFIALVNELPDSSRMSVSVTFIEGMDFRAFAEFENKYKNTSYQYLATSLMSFNSNLGDEHTLTTSAVVMAGFSPITQYDDKFISEKYPYLDIGMISDGEDLWQHYISLVRLLVDNKEFVDMLDTENEGLYDRYNSILNCLENGSASVSGARITVNKQDMLDMIESGVIRYAVYEDVKLSK
ncbi:anti sigma factor C-terminal domain-containing protein [Breznakia pachnodae]|uniref:Sigma factor regulator C-terminal domain-containing protein n=1 Tax=Breznakia pachnodae TaxID=265178 RepID=A0ABU0DZF5_9FIRM|nr:anti sigma factor C-terminal domain-containing protein [Breznakia pachnodae]MDQ0360017.1 hypothetical protein [Breznakia pachnodae]